MFIDEIEMLLNSFYVYCNKMTSVAFFNDHMSLFLQRTILAGFMCLVSLSGHAQVRHTISGYVKDDQSGETLIGANVYLENDAKTGTVTNTYGFFSMTLPESMSILRSLLPVLVTSTTWRSLRYYQIQISISVWCKALRCRR